MKKYVVMVSAMIMFSFILFSTNSDAQNGKQMKNGSTHKCTNFVDANNDGKCDSYVDSNGDGKCDNATADCSGTCKGEGNGTCKGTKAGKGNCGTDKANCTGTGVCDGTAKGTNHKCAKFVDANNDGKCDSYVDANGDGKCDNKSAATCDGAGKGKMHGNKGNCGSSCGTKANTSANTATLNQNYPNPVTDNTKIAFNLKAKSDVKVTLSDNNGNLVKELLNGNLPAGDHSVDLNAKDLNPGNYFYSITVGGKVQSKQMIVVK